MYISVVDVHVFHGYGITMCVDFPRVV